MKAISLFTGAGGMDVGFMNAGFDILLANEVDPHACDTYRSNHSKIQLLESDIKSFLPIVSKYKGKVDLVFGGPPCQGFSVAGKMDVDDPRSQLIFTFLDVIKLTLPKVFVMENVKALGKLEKFSLIRKEFISKAHSLNYSVSKIILNSRDFGVPQSRVRVFFIGRHRNLHEFTIDDFAPWMSSPPTLRETIAHLGPAGSEGNNRLCKAKITNATNPILRKSPYAGMLFNGQGRPLNPDGYSTTLPASMGGNRTPIIDENHMYEKYNAPWIEEYHSHLSSGGKPKKMNDIPNHLRRLTIDEAALIQTFPNNYIFKGPNSKVFSQIGNAVPCKLATAVANTIKAKVFVEEELSTDCLFSLTA